MKKISENIEVDIAGRIRVFYTRENDDLFKIVKELENEVERLQNLHWGEHGDQVARLNEILLQTEKERDEALEKLNKIKTLAEKYKMNIGGIETYQMTSPKKFLDIVEDT